MAFEVMLPPGGGPLIFEWRRACSGTVEAASVFSQLPLTLSPCVPCPRTADCGLEITRIAQVDHKRKTGQPCGREGDESERGGAAGGRARRQSGKKRGRATLARARQRGQLAELFFFFSFRTRAPPRAPALPRTTSGVRSAAARAWYARVCVCVCCVRAAALAGAFSTAPAHTAHPLSLLPPPYRSRPSPTHSQRPRHPHTHTHPSSLHTIFQGSCSSLRPVFYSNAAGFSAYSGSADCVGAQGAVAVMVPAGALTAACCADMRSFAAAGCTCDADVMELLVGLKVLPAGASPDATMGGIVALFQASQCAGAALGGPLLDACTGGVGCVATA